MPTILALELAMNYRLHIHKKAYSQSDSAQASSQIRTRPNALQAKPNSGLPGTHQEIENKAFQQHKYEATKLEIQAKYGTITPLGQERLTILQAKMSDFWQQRLEHSSRFGHNFANIAVNRPDTPLPPIQRKLTIGEPGDKYEQEADRVAAQVVSLIDAPGSQPKAQNQTVQREKLPDEENLMMKPQTGTIQREQLPEEEDDQLMMKPFAEHAGSALVQRQPGGGGMAATPDLEASIQQARGSGQPLSNNIQKPMEQAFGADFSGVKIHTDAQSDMLNRSIQARAFTTGQDIFFGQGAYDPRSRGGQELIAHELTHVVQQNGAAVQRKPKEKTESIELIQAAVLDEAETQEAPQPVNGRITRKFLQMNGQEHLIKGINDKMKEPEIIGKLIENFYNRTDFDYNFSRNAPFSKKGDCGVLVDEFIKIAKDIFNIQNITSDKGNQGYFIPGGRKIVHKDNKTGNVDEGKHWFFEEHVWAVWNGKPIDVLFGQLGVVSHQAGVRGEYDPKDGTVRYTAGNVVFYLKNDSRSEFDRYTTNREKMLRMGPRK